MATSSECHDDNALTEALIIGESMEYESPSVSRTKWHTDRGGNTGRCLVCPWRQYAGTMDTLNRWVSAHVRETGHRVVVTRSQWKLVTRDEVK